MKKSIMLLFCVYIKINKYMNNVINDILILWMLLDLGMFRIALKISIYLSIYLSIY